MLSHKILNNCSLLKGKNRLKAEPKLSIRQTLIFSGKPNFFLTFLRFRFSLNKIWFQRFLIAGLIKTGIY